MRVATRRLRAAIEVFWPCFPPKQGKQILAEVKALADALGERRDRDVAIEALGDVRRVDAASRSARDLLVDRRAPGGAGGRQRRLGRPCRARSARTAPRRTARARRDRASCGPRRRRAGDSGRRMKARKVRKLDPAGPLAENAARIVLVRIEELRSFAPRALEPDAAEVQHDMRIAAKRLRYVLEATGFCFGRPAATARKRAKELQDLLGEIHDGDVMLPRLAEHRAALIAADAENVRQRAGDATDLEPGLAARAPHRTPYRGLDMLEVHLRARRAAALRPLRRPLARERGARRLAAAHPGGRQRARPRRRGPPRCRTGRAGPPGARSCRTGAPGGRRPRHSRRRRAGRGRGRGGRLSLADGGRLGGSDSDGRPSAAPARLAVYS